MRKMLFTLFLVLVIACLAACNTGKAPGSDTSPGDGQVVDMPPDPDFPAVFLPPHYNATIEYGEPDLITDNAGPLWAYIRFPVADAATDAVIEEWALAAYQNAYDEIAELCKEDPDVDAEINIQFDSYFVNDRYAGIIENGMYMNSHMAHPSGIVRTFNIDTYSGAMLANGDILDYTQLEDILALMHTRIIEEYPETSGLIGEMDEKWLEHIAFGHDGVIVAFERGAILPAYLGTLTVTLPYDKLGSAFKLGAEFAPGYTPEPNPGSSGGSGSGSTPGSSGGSGSGSTPGSSGGSGTEPTPGSSGGSGAEPTPGSAGGSGAEPTPGTPGGSGAEPTPGTPGGSGAEPTPGTPGGSTTDPSPESPGGSTTDPSPESPGGSTTDPSPESPVSPTPEPTPIPTAEPPSPIIPNLPPQGGDIDPSKPMIALTFDDGPSKYTSHVLDILEKHGARATFCVIGNLVSARKDTVKRASGLGNEIIGHSWDHRDLTKLSADEIIQEIKDTSDVIESVTGIRPRMYRPPYGAVNAALKSVSADLGYALINWSVDPMDWQSRDADKVYDAIMSNVSNRAIVLSHDLYGTTADAMERVIPELIAMGYQLVTVSELMYYSGKTLEPGVVYHNGK